MRCFPLTVDISLLAEVNNFVLLPLKHDIFEQSRKYRWREQLLTDIWRLKHGTYWYMKVYGGFQNTKTSVTSSILVIQVWNSGYTKYHFLDFSTFLIRFFLINSDMNTTLDNRMLTTVCDTQKLCSYLHVFPPLCGHTSSAWIMRSTDICISGVITHTSPLSPPLATSLVRPY